MTEDLWDVGLKGESKGVGKHPKKSPATQMKYFTQETKTFTPFYFSYRTPYGHGGEDPTKHTFILC